MWNKLKNVRTVLFMTYSMIIVVVFTVLVLWFYFWTSDLLRKNAIGSMDGTGRSMLEQVDSEIQKMNDVSLNVMYSSLVKSHFRKFLDNIDASAPSPDQPLRSPSLKVESAKELAEILTAIIGPSRPIEQLYLYDLKSKVYGNGFDNGERTYNPEEKEWFGPVTENQSGKWFGLPSPDEEMSRFISSSGKQYSLSLFRQFYDNYNTPIGIIEVKQYYNRIFKSVLDFSANNPYGARTVVYDREGHILYPLNADRAALSSYLIRESGGRSGDFRTLTNAETGVKELLTLHDSELTGWTLMTIVSEDKLLKPLDQFTKQTVPVALLIMLFAILLSFVAARSITLPILRLHRMIRGMRLEDLGAGRDSEREPSSGLNELDQLQWSFLKMRERLKESMDDLLLAQSQELQTKLTALQSQMNPHFLYNTLATIHAMAEENMNDQIVAMSENMSDFLRYLSSDEPMVHLEDEVQHTVKYLEVNRIRFGHKLQFEVDIDPELLKLRIPKLILQPLVENALKFCTRKEPPWIIRISGALHEDGGWSLRVSDNGYGFTSESLEALQARIREIDETNVIPVLKLDGMGLLNIYIRMKLTYAGSTVFRIDNSPGSGADVVLGGHMADERSEISWHRISKSGSSSRRMRI